MRSYVAGPKVNSDLYELNRKSYTIVTFELANKFNVRSYKAHHNEHIKYTGCLRTIILSCDSYQTCTFSYKTLYMFFTFKPKALVFFLWIILSFVFKIDDTAIKTMSDEELKKYLPAHGDRLDIR